MKVPRTLSLLLILGLALFGGIQSAVAASAPPPPNLLGPANGASVTVPFTISWSAVSDPSGIAAYNWQVSPSSSMSPVIKIGSTMGATQDSISGLANGTYYWHVDAVNNNFVTGQWSKTQSFTVTGATAGEPGSPTLNPIKGGTQFHPMETFHFDWTAVPGAATYTVDASTDPNFPVATEVHFDNIPNTFYALTLGDSEPQGTWYLRVSAVDANHVAGVPSNRDTFVLSFNAPLPPPPTLLGPANGTTVAFPVTLSWTDVPNPQDSGYVLEVATDPGFNNIEFVNNQITGPQWTIRSLTAGTKYWHVLSTQGDSAPGVPAHTAFSSTGSFVVPATPPTVASLAAAVDPASAGDTQTVSIQLTGPAPAGGAVVNLTTSNATAAPAPATFTMPAGMAFNQFRFQVGGVSATTVVTLTATLNASTASASFTVRPPTLQSVSVFTPITGGVATSAIVMLTGAAPAGGAVVSLSSSSPAASPPATATVPAGNQSVTVNVPTSAVTSSTTTTITASWNGSTVQTQLTLSPQQPPTSLTLNPTTTSGATGSTGTVTIASPATSDLTLPLTSSNPSVAVIPNSVQIPAGTTAGSFSITSAIVSAQTVVTISVSGAGVTKTATLTVNPPSTAPPTPTPAPASGISLASLTLNPTSVRSGDPSTATVTLSGPAPSTGMVVSLTTSNSALATVPSSVTVAAGSTSTTFEVRTQQLATNGSVTITGASGGVSQSAALALTPH